MYAVDLSVRHGIALILKRENCISGAVNSVAEFDEETYCTEDEHRSTEQKFSSIVSCD